MLASQRIEWVVGNWFWASDQAGQNQSAFDFEVPTKRGATPTAIEWMILAWVSFSLISIKSVERSKM